jgi:protocatechuate 3,4-dioxygenase, beta subunit
MENDHWTPLRRDLLKASAAMGIAGVLSPVASVFAQATPLRPTPEQIMGPFYPMSLVPNRTGNLAAGANGIRAKGQLIVVTGRVTNVNGEPLKGIKLEIWQANAVGRYAHASDTGEAALDPNFEGFGQVTTDAEGHYRFRTIKPGAYPAGRDGMRPAHIHFDVAGRIDRRVTQMYFDGDPYIEKDRILQSVLRPDRLIVKLQPAKPELDPEAQVAVFDIVLAKG